MGLSTETFWKMRRYHLIDRHNWSRKR